VRLANAHSLNLKPQNHEPRNPSQTQSSPRNGLHPAGNGYILLATMSGIAFFGRFIFALITN